MGTPEISIAFKMKVLKKFSKTAFNKFCCFLRSSMGIQLLMNQWTNGQMGQNEPMDRWVMHREHNTIPSIHAKSSIEKHI